MTKEEAKAIAIELAKSVIASPTGNVPICPNSKTASEIADFIQTLTDRLADE